MASYFYVIEYRLDHNQKTIDGYGFITIDTEPGTTGFLEEVVNSIIENIPDFNKSRDELMITTFNKID